MALEVTMPQMGESVVEGTIEKWLVKVGDEVTEDQPLVAISTDKVDTEIPSPGAGRVAEIIAKEGETLPVGAKLAIIESASAPARPAKPVATAPKATEPPPIPKPSPQPPARREDGAGDGRRSRVVETPPPPAEHRRYSPVVMRIAEEHGIDLSRVPASGLGGRVSKRDIERYLESLEPGASAAPSPAQPNGSVAPAPTPAARPSPAPQAPGIAPPASTPGAFRPPVYQPREGDTVEPFTRRRKIIAEHMVYSKTHAPHVGTVAEVDVTRVMALRERHKAAFQSRESFALTLLPLAAAATVRALKEFPRMNAAVAGDSLVIRKEINLGIAMDTDEGLLVPVIKQAEGMSVTGLAREIEKLRKKTAEKNISADDLSGGSFTLSNPGREGNLYGFAIINQPQVGILRMGEVKKRPVIVEVDGADAIAIRTMMYLALSYDHRVIDGVLGNRFLFRVAKILEEADFDL